MTFDVLFSKRAIKDRDLLKSAGLSEKARMFCRILFPTNQRATSSRLSSRQGKAHRLRFTHVVPLSMSVDPGSTPGDSTTRKQSQA